jgi:hypothetical protein
MSALVRTLAAGLKAQHPDLPDADRARLAREQADAISSTVVTTVQEQRRAEKWDRLGPMECAARMRTAEAMALEAAIAEALEPLPAETSSPSPG